MPRPAMTTQPAWGDAHRHHRHAETGEEEARGSQERHPGLAGHVDAGVAAVVLGADALGAMLVFEEGVAGGDDRSLGEVIFRHRGRQRPLEGAAIPRIVGALLAAEGGPGEVGEGEQHAEAEAVDAAVVGGDLEVDHPLVVQGLDEHRRDAAETEPADGHSAPSRVPLSVTSRRTPTGPSPAGRVGATPAPPPPLTTAIRPTPRRTP